MPDLEDYQIDAEDLDRGRALSKSEFDFISKMNSVCVILARAPTHQTAIRDVASYFDCDEAKAKLLIRKADDFLSSGLMTSAQKAKELYMSRLQAIHDLCMSRAVETQVEVTRRPTKVVEEGTGRFRVISAEHIKTKPNALNVTALRLAMDAATQMARVGGVENNKDGQPAAPPTVNVQINNLPGAKVTHELSNRDLAQLAGFSYAEPEGVLQGEATEVADQQNGEAGTEQADGHV